MGEKSDSNKDSTFDDISEPEELSTIDSLDSVIQTDEPDFSLPEEEINLDALNDFMESEV